MSNIIIAGKRNNMHDNVWASGTTSAYQGHLLPLSSIEAPSGKPHNQAMETSNII
jgi:hypothetical protein